MNDTEKTKEILLVGIDKQGNLTLQRGDKKVTVTPSELTTIKKLLNNM